MFNNLNINNILNGLSKTLGVIDKALPMVDDIKPIFNGAKSFFTKKNTEEKETNATQDVELKKESNNNISFFQ